MMPNSKFIALLGVLGVPVSKLLYRDLPRDVNPSVFITYLASFAVVAECTLGAACLFSPTVFTTGSLVTLFGAPITLSGLPVVGSVGGVFLATAFHVYILSMT